MFASKTVLSLAVVAFLAGCASAAVTGDALTQRTASAIGAAPGTFTIANRTDSGVRTDYTVTTNSGQHYNCYVTGGVSVLGRVVSDAICNKPGEAAKNPLLAR